jgi:hypothetical protein
MAANGRLVEQLIMRLAVWVGLNIYVFWDIGFSALLSLNGALWVIGGTLFVLTIWGLIASFFERLWMMKGWHINIWRTLEYVSMYLISKNVMNSIF